MHEKWTGERLVTTLTHEVMLEHLHRYAFAMEFCKNKKVLDIACGEGYGCNLMSKLALEVTGIDINETTIDKASTKYKEKNIKFLKGSILDIPVEEGYFDLITCFETLEHIDNHEKAIHELKRVLRTDGLLLLSTPDKLTYSDETGYTNPFHLKELYKEEFKNLLCSYFKEVKLFGQQSHSLSLITVEENQTDAIYFTGDYQSIKIVDKPKPVYWIAMASDTNLPSLNNSIFLHPQTISEIQDAQTRAIHQTFTYRLGNAILYPVKFIKKVFGK